MSLKVQKKGGEANVLDAQLQFFLDNLEEGGTALREIHPNEIRSASSPTEPYHLEPLSVDVEDIFVSVRDSNEIRVRIYRKDKNINASPLIYFHGGCWVFCSIESHDSLCRQICYDSGMTVFSVDYRLAPEAKFPSAINDAYDVTQWIINNQSELDLLSVLPILSGDSAGANIATVTALQGLKNKDFKIRAQVLFYPITDISTKASTYKSYTDGYFLSEELMDYGAHHYVNSELERKDPRISPLLEKHLVGMPKTLIQSAEFDVLRDEGEAYAKKLYQVGVDVECVRYNGAIHAYLALAGGVELGREALNDAIDFLKRINIKEN